MSSDSNLFPAGRYLARPVLWMLTETKSGAEQYAVELEVTSPDEALAGQHLTWFGGFSSDKATEITVKALRVLGWTGDDLDAVALATDKDVSITVEHEEYQGKTQVRVRWINPLGGLAVRAPLAADRRRGFAERMRGAIAGIDAKTGWTAPPAAPGNGSAPRAPAPAPAAPPAGVDDDIPF